MPFEAALLGIPDVAVFLHQEHRPWPVQGCAKGQAAFASLTWQRDQSAARLCWQEDGACGSAWDLFAAL